MKRQLTNEAKMSLTPYAPSISVGTDRYLIIQSAESSAPKNSTALQKGMKGIREVRASVFKFIVEK